MGTDRARAQYEGILRMDRRARINTTLTTVTEGSPQVGPITADSGFQTEAVIVASGTPADGDPLLLRGMKAGSPGVNRAGFAWRENTGQNWYGWDVPSVITGFEFVEDATVATTGFPYPQPVPLSNGKIVIVAGDDTNTKRGVSVRNRDTDGTYTANTQLYQETRNTGLDRLHPRGVLLESGRMLIYHATMDLENNEMQVRMMYSDTPDVGSSFVEGEAGVLATAFDLVGGTVSFDRMRVVRSPDTGQYLMTIESTNAAGVTLTQYASRTGVRFEQVGSAIQVGPLGHDLAYVGGFFVLAHTSALSIVVRWRRVGSAFAALSSATEIISGVAVGLPDTDAVSMSVSDDGVIYTYAGIGVLGFAVSEDAGATWLKGASNGISYAGLGVRLTGHSAAFYRGYVYLVGNQTDPAANVLALTAMRMGGYSDLTLPPERITVNVGRQAWYTDGWVGHDMLSSFFSDASVGAPVESRNTDGSWSVVTGVGVTARYDDEVVDGADYIEIIAAARVLVNSGEARLSVTSSRTAPDNTQVQIRVDSDILMFDVNAGAQIGATAVGVGSSKVDLILAVNGTDATGWYSIVDDGDHKRTWVQIATTSTLTEAAASVTNRVRLIVRPSSDADWWFANFIREGEAVAGSSTTLGRSMADGVTLPDDLFARGLPAVGASYVNDDVSIRGVDGPLLRGTELTMEITHPRPIENVFPFQAPSPRQIWRDTAAVADTKLTLSIATFPEESHAGSDTIGVYLGSLQCEHVRVEGRNTAGVFSTIADIDRSTSGLEYVRDGNTIRPRDTGGQVVGPYFQRDELAGSYFIVDSGTGDTRTIVGNSEGHFAYGSSLTEKRCVIYLDRDEITGAEATSGTTGKIVHKDTVTYIHLAGSNTFRAYRLIFHPAAVGVFDTPPGGTFDGGVVMVGPMALFGKRQDAEYTTTRAAQVETQELIDGTTRTRVVAPSRRTVVVNFNDGVDVTTARGTSDSDFVSNTATAGGEPVAHVRDLPLMLDGLLDELDGESTMVVYCPNVPRGPVSGAGDVITLRAQRAGGAVYGRVVGAVTHNAVLGDPMLTEVITGPSITIREEV